MQSNSAKLAVFSMAALSLGCNSVKNDQQSDNQQEKPNIVLFFIDDLGWRDVGFMGSNYYETPNIDKLASEGMIFTNAYANAPNSAPSRACLMSGKYSPRHGVYTVGSSERGESINRKLIPTKNKTVLDTSFVTIAEALKPAGYTSIQIGKFHLGSDNEGTGPIAQGFNYNVAGDYEGMPPSYFYPYCRKMKNGNDWCLKFLEGGEEGEYLTDRLTDEAVKFLDEHYKDPFFMYFAHYAVHTPIQGKEELVKKYESKQGDSIHNNPTYAAMIQSMDESLGRLNNKLEELGVAENTIIVFFSDNGGHGPTTKMHPLRGVKGMLYEGGIREPMFVKWPGVVEQGSTCETPVIGIDFYPTFLEMAGAKTPGNYTLDGKSIVPLLKQNGAFEREAIYWHFPAYLQGYKPGMIWRTTPVAVIRAGDYKLIEFFEDSTLELYNLKEDIGEKHNLADEMPEKKEELYRMMLEWRQETNAPVPIERNPEYKAE